MSVQPVSIADTKTLESIRKLLLNKGGVLIDFRLFAISACLGLHHCFEYYRTEGF